MAKKEVGNMVRVFPALEADVLAWAWVGELFRHIFSADAA